MDRVLRFAQNVKDKVRGIDPAIDYSHKADDIAAGWVKDAEARPNGLWVFVEWTKAAIERIKNKEFRYFSADFSDEWTDPEGKKHQDVLNGGGLTNRPFLKNLVPVNLSELYGKGKEKEEDESMELTEQLREALGLSEDATEQDALDAIKKLQETTPPDPTPNPLEGLDKELSEHPLVKNLVDEVSQLRSERTLSEATRLTETWTTHSTKKFALPPAVSEDLTKMLVENPKLNEQFSKVFDAILESGLIKLGEKGRAHGEEDDSTDNPSGEVNVAITKLMEENKDMTFADAYSQVLSDPELYARYRDQSFAGALNEVNEGDES
jgi:hypothetical protein